MDLDVWFVTWTKMGVRHFIDFDDMNDALLQSLRIEESDDRENVWVRRRTGPELDAATEELIKARVKSRLRGDALLESLVEWHRATPS